MSWVSWSRLTGREGAWFAGSSTEQDGQAGPAKNQSVMMLVLVLVLVLLLILILMLMSMLILMLILIVMLILMLILM